MENFPKLHNNNTNQYGLRQHFCSDSRELLLLCWKWLWVKSQGQDEPEAWKGLIRWEALDAGLPDGLFSNQKKTILGKFWRALEWNMLIHFTAIWNIIQTFGLFYDHLVQFVLIFFGFGIMFHEQSGNPVWMATRQFRRIWIFTTSKVSTSIR
jgi:hypothetical protein